MGAWAEPWIFFNITAFRKKNPRFPEMNHPFCLLQKKRHQNWLWDGRAEQDPWLPFLIGVIQASPFANSVLLFGPTWQQQRWIMEVFHATQKDEIICLLMKTLLSHWRLWIMAAGGSASLIGALQVRMHQRDMNCMKSKATNAIYATLYSEGNFRVLFTQWHESPRWLVIWHHKRKQFVIILRSSLLAAKPKPIDLFYFYKNIPFNVFGHKIRSKNCNDSKKNCKNIHV